jgi:hypothetical protein
VPELFEIGFGFAFSILGSKRRITTLAATGATVIFQLRLFRQGKEVFVSDPET